MRWGESLICSIRFFRDGEGGSELLSTVLLLSRSLISLSMIQQNPVQLWTNGHLYCKWWNGKLDKRRNRPTLPLIIIYLCLKGEHNNTNILAGINFAKKKNLILLFCLHQAIRNVHRQLLFGCCQHGGVLLCQLWAARQHAEGLRSGDAIPMLWSCPWTCSNIQSLSFTLSAFWAFWTLFQGHTSLSPLLSIKLKHLSSLLLFGAPPAPPRIGLAFAVLMSFT